MSADDTREVLEAQLWACGLPREDVDIILRTADKYAVLLASEAREIVRAA